MENKTRIRATLVIISVMLIIVFSTYINAERINPLNPHETTTTTTATQFVTTVSTITATQFSTILVPINQTLQEPCSYLISTNGSFYSSRNCFSGIVSFSGTNGSGVIDNTINQIAYIGGLIDIESGIYRLNNTIVANASSGHIQGIVLQALGSYPSVVFQWIGSIGGTIMQESGMSKNQKRLEAVS